MSDEPKIVASATMSAEAYARLCEEARVEGITPEELLHRKLSHELWQRMKPWLDRIATEN